MDYLTDSSPSPKPEPPLFNHYFTLDEAVALLNDVNQWMREARNSIKSVQDDIVLQKRILMIQKKSGQSPTKDNLSQLKKKYQRFEDTLDHWQTFFEDKGILVKDFGKGLIDFPYHSKSLNEDFLLCWHLGEEGIFYFHEINTGYRGRKPISLLPE